MSKEVVQSLTEMHTFTEGVLTLTLISVGIASIAAFIIFIFVISFFEDREVWNEIKDWWNSKLKSSKT